VTTTDSNGMPKDSGGHNIASKASHHYRNLTENIS
jgi:hypothetical protein